MDETVPLDALPGEELSPVQRPAVGIADSLAFEVPPPKNLLESFSASSTRYLETPSVSSIEVSRDVKVLARRIKDLESRQQSVEERFVQDRFACPDGGPSPSQWSQMQGEMERVRRLFEFVESLLPREPAEAMRFFNRAKSKDAKDCNGDAWKEQAVGEVASEGRLLGLDVEMARYKAHIEKEFKKAHDAMHKEVSNCMVAIKGAQRDVDVMRGALVAERPRPLPGAEALVGGRARLPAAASATASIEGTGGTRNEDCDAGPGQLVSRQHVQQEIANLREEVKSWLDQLGETFRTSLRHKADKQSFLESDQSGIARRALLGRTQQSPGNAGFDAGKTQGSSWRPSTSPGTKQLRAPGAALCGPGSRSLPKFPSAPAEADRPPSRTSRPFGPETVKSLQR
jgi:hypothetical protein